MNVTLVTVISYWFLNFTLLLTALYIMLSLPRKMFKMSRYLYTLVHPPYVQPKFRSLLDIGTYANFSFQWHSIFFPLLHLLCYVHYFCETFFNNSYSHKVQTNANIFLLAIIILYVGTVYART